MITPPLDLQLLSGDALVPMDQWFTVHRGDILTHTKGTYRRSGCNVGVAPVPLSTARGVCRECYPGGD